MKRSTERILTTHTGSLPRPDDLAALLLGHDQREVQKDRRVEQRVGEAVREVVRRQVEAGVDVIDDGEAGKVGYSTYVTDRLTGFDGQGQAQPAGVEDMEFPEYYQSLTGRRSQLQRPACSGPISWRGED